MFVESPSSIKIKVRGSQSSVSNQQSDFSKDCKFACCSSCTFCKRAVAKEKCKTLSCQNRNKICEQCFVCKSMSFCPKCHKCTLCCQRSTCGRPSATVWQVWLSLGSNPRVVSILREGYQLPFKERPPLARFPVIVSGSSNPSQNKSLNEALHSLGQKQTIEKVSVQSSLGFYNRLFLVPKPNGKWRPILDLSQLNLYLAPATFKMETPGGATGGVGHFAGFQRRLFSHPHKPQVAKISRVPLKRSDLSVHSTSLWPVDGSVGVHKGGQGGKTHGSIERYSDPPIPRRLITESPMPGNLPTSYADPFGPMPLSRLGSQHVRAGSPTNLRLCRLSFRPISGVSQTNSGQVEESISEAQPSPGTGMLLSQAVHVFDRPSDGNRKTSSIGAAAYETHSMAPEKALACPGISGKSHSNSPISMYI